MKKSNAKRKQKIKTFTGTKRTKPVKKTNRKTQPRKKSLQFKTKNLLRLSVKSNRNRNRKGKKKFATYQRGQHHQLTYTFPNDLKENQKVANLKQWDAAPLQQYINANRIRKGKYSITGDAALPGTTGSRPPQAVYIKLAKRKPRSKELFYSAVLSPENFVVNRANVHAFSVGVLEKYYSDFNEKQSDKEAGESKYKRKDSDPSDYEGKPLKVVAVIYQFIY